MNAETPALRHVETVEELIQEVGVKLLSVFPYRLLGERADDFRGNVPDEFEIDHELSVMSAIAPNKLAVRLIAKLVVQGVCSAEIDYAAEWEPTEPVELSPEAFRGFVNRIAVMAIWPYTRQAAQDLFLRTAQVAVPIPTIQPNEFEFGAADPADDTNGAGDTASD